MLRAEDLFLSRYLFINKSIYELFSIIPTAFKINLFLDTMNNIHLLFI